MNSARQNRRRVVVGSRIHTMHKTGDLNLDHLAEWCRGALEGAEAVVLAVDSANLEQTRAITAPLGPLVNVIHVSPWDGFSGPLNALVAHSARLGATHLLLRSLEIEITVEDFRTLLDHADTNTLVVGAQLDGEHGGAPGVKPLDGLTTPWNTLALWNVATLCLTGFLSVSDGLHAPHVAGVEEVVTISLLQSLRPKETRAVLLRLPRIRWHTRWSNILRQQHHDLKLTTKVARSEAQLDRLGIPRGSVIVLDPC
jgi:hypothetical protein